ncbi:MAG TPA: tautomerase family protein [Pseudonocardiaceae bacterium]|nr:tautomerase family protein [Pseudonocardiaceae bacterium]
MPFVRITVRSDTDEATRLAMSAGVHAALIEALGVPKGDRFQIIEERPASAMIFDRDYLDGDRRNVVCVEITLAKGRDEARKRALYRALAANLGEAGVRPEDVFVLLNETNREDWSFGGGEMQMLDEPLLRKYGWKPPDAA